MIDQLSTEEGARPTLLFATRPEPRARISEIERFLSRPDYDKSAILVTTQECIEVREMRGDMETGMCDNK